jgi:hypothetical protein
MPPFHASVGPFKAVGTFLRKICGAHPKTSMLLFHDQAGLFKVVGNILGINLPGPSENINAGFAWSGGPIQSSRKHFRDSTTGSIREHRCRLCILRWAHSKQSETFLREICLAHPRTSMPPFHDQVGPFKAVGNILGIKLLGSSENINAGFAWSGGPIQSIRKHFRDRTTGPMREHQCRLCILRWARSKPSETFLREICLAHPRTSMPPFHDQVGPFKAVGNILGTKLPGPSENINAGFPCCGGPIQSSRNHFRDRTTWPIRKHRCLFFMIRWALSKWSETFSG